MTLTVSVVVGNPKPRSRTLDVAMALVERLLGCDARVIDLADYADEVFDRSSERVSSLNERVASSDVVVFASPTYKATYTGLLKAFLDRYQPDALAGVVAIAVMTGADLSHSLGPDAGLVPLLTELGAVVPGRGFYFVTSDMDHLDEIATSAADRYAVNLALLSKVAAAAGGLRLPEVSRAENA